MLGMWVHKMRRDFKNKITPQWQVDKMDCLQFAWDVDQISAKWHHNFHEARRYKVGVCLRPRLLSCAMPQQWLPWG